MIQRISVIGMNISGIRPYGGVYGYNSIQAEDVLPAGTASPEQSGTVDQAAPERDYGKQTFGAADLARQYQPEASYELKGADSDIRSLDVERALSDLQKDQVLQQYQFFVGTAREQNGSMGMTVMGGQNVRAMENFDF